MKRHIAIGVLLLLAFFAPSASAADKIPIYVNASTDDIVGTTYTFQLREALKASQSYELVLTQTASVFAISIISLDQNKGTLQENSNVIASVALVINNNNGYDYLVSHWIISSGSKNVDTSVRNLIAAVDKAIQVVVQAAAAKKG